MSKSVSDAACARAQSLGKDGDLLFSQSTGLSEAVPYAAALSDEEPQIAERAGSDRLRKLQMVTRAAFKFGGPARKSAGAKGVVKGCG